MATAQLIANRIEISRSRARNRINSFRGTTSRQMWKTRHLLTMGAPHIINQVDQAICPPPSLVDRFPTILYERG